MSQDTSKKLSSINRVISELRHAITSEQRLMVINQAKDQFNHTVTEIHDIEVQSGASNVLCLQLGYALNKKYCDLNIINSICCTLVFVYHCSNDVRKNSYDLIGAELIPLLIKLLERCKLLKQKTKKVTEESNNIDTILQIMKILHLFSAVQSVANSMATNRGVLTALVAGIQNHFPESVKLAAISTFKNISFHAEEHRISMVEEPSFISSIIQLSYESASDQISEDISETVKNLALAQDVKVPMAQQGILLNTILSYIGNRNEKIKLNAVLTLGSLAVAPENGFWLVSHSEGALIDVILQLTIDTDFNIQDRALKTLKRIGRGESIPILVDHKDVLVTLFNLICSGSSIHVQMEATELITSFLVYLTNGLTSQLEKVLQCMIDLSTKVMNVFCLEVIFKSFMEVSIHDEVSALMVANNQLLQVFISSLSLVVQSSSTAYYGLKTLHNMLISSSYQAVSEKVVSCQKIMSSLISIPKLMSKAHHPEFMSKVGIEILVLLAKTETNQLTMARYDGLLIALVQYITDESNVTSTMKESVKETILALVPLV